MTTEQFIQTILERLGGIQFILMTETKFSYGINEKQQPYLCCILPENLTIKSRANRFIISYSYVVNLYQVTLTHQRYNECLVIKIVDDVSADDLIAVFEHETGICCTLTTLI